MSGELDFHFERRSSTTVGVRAKAGERLLRTASIDPFRPKQIVSFVQSLVDLGLQLDVDKTINEITQKAIDCHDAKARNGKPAQPEDHVANMPPELKAEAMERLHHERLLYDHIDAVQALGVAGEDDLIATYVLVGVSRMLDHPLASITTGASSAGKSFVLDRTAMLFPPESLFQVTTTSSKAFYYLDENALEHRWVILGEQSRVDSPESEDTKRHLRQMLSDGKISREVALAKDGVIRTERFEMRGPIAYSDTTTRVDLFVEDLNRCILLHPDEGEEQTRNVVLQVTNAFQRKGMSSEEKEHLVQLHHAMHRLLSPHTVKIPYAGLLGQSLDTTNLEMRRAVELFCSAICANCLLYQYQRQTTPDGRFLLADASDYAVAVELLGGWLAESMAGELPAASLQFFRWLQQTFEASEGITVSGCVSRGISRGRATYQLQKLATAGLVEQPTLGGRNRAGMFRLSGQGETHAKLGLPSVEDVQNFTSHEFSKSATGLNPREKK